MPLFDNLAKIFEDIQHNSLSFTKNLNKIVNNYDKECVKEYSKVLVQFLYANYVKAPAYENEYTARSLQFLAKVVIKLVIKQTEPEDNPDGDGKIYDITDDLLLLFILKKSVKYYNINLEKVRYNTVFFLEALLQNIGSNVEMENRAFSDILKPLMDSLYDSKVIVRCKAIDALKHLQEPLNSDCVVIKEFLKHFGSPSPKVRASIIKYIVPNTATVPKIKDFIRDINPMVRQAAFEKISMYSPQYLLKISERIYILRNGFALAKFDKVVRHILEKKLLPKWLNFFNCDYLKLLKSVKLDSEEKDFLIFMELGNDIMKVFLRDKPIREIIDQLPIDKEKKVISLDKLTLETVLYWSSLVTHLRRKEDTEDLLEEVIPELTPFVQYLQSIMEHMNSKKLEDHEFSELQFIFCQLLDISSNYDFSDEVGKRTFYETGMDALLAYKFDSSVIQKWIKLLQPHCSNLEEFVTNLCGMIDQILEPSSEPILTQKEIRERQLMISQLKVQLTLLEMRGEEAITNKEFAQAAVFNTEYENLKKKLETLQMTNFVPEDRIAPKDDPETLCKCLDLLIGIFCLPQVSNLTSSLIKCYEEFLMPLITNALSEVHCRVFQCLCFICKINKDMAFKHAKFICLPCAAYATPTNYDKSAVKYSVYGITALVSTYGVEVIENNDNSAESQNSNKRKLYNNDALDLMIMNNDCSVKVKDLFSIMLTMFDDENEDLAFAAAEATRVLLLIDDFPINEKLLSTLILKYFTPGLQYVNHLASDLQNFAKKSSNKALIGRALEPTLLSIATAPGRSPLKSIDLDSLIKFFITLTDNEVHVTLMKEFLQKIENEPEVTPYFMKLLQNLSLPQDVDSCKEILNIIEDVSEGWKDKKNYMRCINKLKSNVDTMRNHLEGDGTKENLENNHDDQSADVNTVIENGSEGLTNADEQLVIEHYNKNDSEKSNMKKPTNQNKIVSTRCSQRMSKYPKRFSEFLIDNAKTLRVVLDKNEVIQKMLNKSIDTCSTVIVKNGIANENKEKNYETINNSKIVDKSDQTDKKNICSKTRSLSVGNSPKYSLGKKQLIIQNKIKENLQKKTVNLVLKDSTKNNNNPKDTNKKNPQLKEPPKTRSKRNGALNISNIGDKNKVINDLKAKDKNKLDCNNSKNEVELLNKKNETLNVKNKDKTDRSSIQTRNSLQKNQRKELRKPNISLNDNVNISDKEQSDTTSHNNAKNKKTVELKKSDKTRNGARNVNDNKNVNTRSQSKESDNKQKSSSKSVKNNNCVSEKNKIINDSSSGKTPSKNVQSVSKRKSDGDLTPVTNKKSKKNVSTNLIESKTPVVTRSTRLNVGKLEEKNIINKNNTFSVQPRAKKKSLLSTYKSANKSDIVTRRLSKRIPNNLRNKNKETDPKLSFDKNTQEKSDSPDPPKNKKTEKIFTKISPIKLKNNLINKKIAANIISSKISTLRSKRSNRFSLLKSKLNEKNSAPSNSKNNNKSIADNSTKSIDSNSSKSPKTKTKTTRSTKNNSDNTIKNQNKANEEVIKKSLQTKDKKNVNNSLNTPSVLQSLNNTKMTNSKHDKNQSNVSNVMNSTWATSTPIKENRSIRKSYSVTSVNLRDLINNTLKSPELVNEYNDTSNKSFRTKRKETVDFSNGKRLNNNPKRNKKETKCVNSPDSVKENSMSVLSPHEC